MEKTGGSNKRRMMIGMTKLIVSSVRLAVERMDLQKTLACQCHRYGSNQPPKWKGGSKWRFSAREEWSSAQNSSAALEFHNWSRPDKLGRQCHLFSKKKISCTRKRGFTDKNRGGEGERERFVSPGCSSTVHAGSPGQCGGEVKTGIGTKVRALYMTRRR